MSVIITLLIITLVVTTRKKSAWSFWVIVGICFLIGAVLLKVQVAFLDPGFSHSLGDALVIATILAITVDIYMKERVLREVSSDVSKYLIGYRLPTEVQDRIRGLLQTRWIRRNNTVRLRITEIPNKPGWVRKDVFISKDLENITTSEEQFEDCFYYESNQPETIVEMRCDSPDPSVQYVLTGPNLAHAKTDEPGAMEALGTKVKIRPVYEGPGMYYRFSIRYAAEHPDNYSDILAFDKPTLGVILEVECPQTIMVSATPADVATPNRWEYRRLFLPGEHIRFRWQRVDVAQ